MNISTVQIQVSSILPHQRKSSVNHRNQFSVTLKMFPPFLKVFSKFFSKCHFIVVVKNSVVVFFVLSLFFLYDIKGQLLSKAA